MREIKFRGKRIDNSKWVYGYLMQMYKPNRMFIGVWQYMGGEATIKDGLFVSYKEVDPDTIGQFTGLLDKNGKEIYEGDILKLQYPLNYGFAGIHNKEIIVTISFESGCFWFTGEGYTDCNWHFYNEYEVVGNIYENPDLL
jgi:uncharacterized phage protein (TIGR01671 family)